MLFEALIYIKVWNFKSYFYQKVAKQKKKKKKSSAKTSIKYVYSRYLAISLFCLSKIIAG